MINEFLVMLGLTGILFIPIILGVITCETNRKYKIGGVIVVIIIWIVFTLGLFYEEKANEKSWNKGFCECGTHWELRGVSKSMTSEKKYYACPNCHSEIEINC